MGHPKRVCISVEGSGRALFVSEDAVDAGLGEVDLSADHRSFFPELPNTLKGLRWEGGAFASSGEVKLFPLPSIWPIQEPE
jgi:hypothetical protein